MAMTFIATGIDEMLLLIILFSMAKREKDVRDVFVGQQIGMTLVLIMTLLAVYGLGFITREWVGLLGILPIAVGIIEFFSGEEEDDDDKILMKTAIFSNWIFRVALIAIAGGAEELAIFIPYFSSLHVKELLIAVVTFTLMIPIWSGICMRLARVGNIDLVINNYRRFIVPIIFIGIGINILLENNTLKAIFSLI